MTMTLNPNGIGGLNPLMGAAGPGANPSNMVPVQPGMGIMAMMASATQPSMAGVGMGPSTMAAAAAAASPVATAQSSPSPHNGTMSQNGTPLSQNGTACRKHSFGAPGQPSGQTSPAAATPCTNQILVPTTLATSGNGSGPVDLEGQQPCKTKNEETLDTTVNIVDRTYF